MGLFDELMKKFEQRRTKSRLKAAFRRKPKPAQVRPKPDDEHEAK